MTVSPPSRTPAQPRSARTALRYALVVTAGLVVLLVLVAGCGAAPLPPAAPSTIVPTTPAPSPPPTTTPPTTVAPTTTPSGTTDGTTENRRTAAPAPQPPRAAPKPKAPAPIWPATDAAAARSLQDQVDGGRQPWLLDPTEVAVSYAGSELGYRNPGVFPLQTGKVDLQDGRSPAKSTITLAQTVRRGEGGIWLVTGVQRR